MCWTSPLTMAPGPPSGRGWTVIYYEHNPWKDRHPGPGRLRQFRRGRGTECVERDALVFVLIQAREAEDGARRDAGRPRRQRGVIDFEPGAPFALMAVILAALPAASPQSAHAKRSSSRHERPGPARGHREGGQRSRPVGGADRVKGKAGRDRLSRLARGADRVNAVDGKRDRAVKGGPGRDVCRVDEADLPRMNGCERGEGQGRRPRPELRQSAGAQAPRRRTARVQRCVLRDHGHPERVGGWLGRRRAPDLDRGGLRRSPSRSSSRGRTAGRRRRDRAGHRRRTLGCSTPSGTELEGNAATHGTGRRGQPSTLRARLKRPAAVAAEREGPAGAHLRDQPSRHHRLTMVSVWRPIALALAALASWPLTTRAEAVTVDTEAELRAAWTDPRQTAIELEADIFLQACKSGEPIRESAWPMTVDGNGHTLRQTCFEKRLLRQDGTGFLLLKDIALTRGGNDGPGAAVTTRGEIEIRDSHVTQNLAEEPGGGIFSMRRATIVRSVITGNLANDDGGGVYARRGGVEVYDSIVSANLVDGSGGAIGSTGDILVVNSHVDGNIDRRRRGRALHRRGRRRHGHQLDRRRQHRRRPGRGDLHAGGRRDDHQLDRQRKPGRRSRRRDLGRGRRNRDRFDARAKRRHRTRRGRRSGPGTISTSPTRPSPATTPKGSAADCSRRASSGSSTRP